MAELTTVRNAILHHRSIMTADKFKKLHKLSSIFPDGQEVFADYDNMHRIFYLIKQDIARLYLGWRGVEAPFNLDDVRGIAIQRLGR